MLNAKNIEPIEDSMSIFKTEYEFELPRGYVDGEGTCHKYGSMRLACAGDEIMPLKDPRVINNPAYLTLILLSRVITKLGNLGKDQINPNMISNLFLIDLKFLKSLYQKINIEEDPRIQAVCPNCENKFHVNFGTVE